MNMEGALRARIIAAATAVGSKVAWVTRPQGSDLPAITLELISGDYPRTHEGLQATRDPRVQLNIWGNNVDQTKPIMEAIIAALAPAAVSNGIAFEPMRFENEWAGAERLGTEDITHHRIDLIVWHHPA